MGASGGTGSRTPGGLGRLGFRGWKIKVPKLCRAKLVGLYNDIIAFDVKVKSLLYYVDEWEKVFSTVKEARARAGKRTPPRPPPLLLLARFTLPDGRERGNKNAPAVVDLRRGELRIPSYGVRVPLRRSLVRALVEENVLTPRPDFVLQLTRKGFLRLIAERALEPPPLALPLRVIAIDENSLHGFAIGVWDVLKASKVVLSRYEKLMPRNRGYIDRMAALLQSAAGGDPEALSEVRGLLPLWLTSTERLAEISALTKGREKRVNEAFIEELVALVRQLAREAKARGWSVVIVVDPVNHKSLKGSRLQRTLLKPRKRLKNLARYEGARFAEYRVSGKRCPLCGREGVEAGRRRYRCAHCGLEWDRDKNAVFQLAQKALASHLREECSDYACVDLAGWLREHPRALL